MPRRTGFFERLDVLHPVILAPMGGGPGTPELAAAVSEAGGLGSIAGGYLTPDQIAAGIRAVRALTANPFAVNLFAGGYAESSSVDPEPMLELVARVHDELGLAAPVLPPLQPNPFTEQIEAVLEARPAAFSFTFGIPERGAMRRLRERGILIFGTATTVEEGRMLIDAGVDAVIAQGAEAGAHRGTFAGPFDSAMIPTLELVAGIAPFSPVIASGGIMDAADLTRSLEKGAFAAQIGTAFLACPESGAAPAYKDALLNAKIDRTVITRAFSGRPARGLRNRFIGLVETSERAILPFPLQNSLTRALRSAAARLGNADYLSLWAGQGVARAKSLPARDVVCSFIEE